MKVTSLYLAAVAVLVAACDGGRSNRAPANAAPAISAIGDQDVSANRTGQPIPFSVSDEQPDALSVSASSDNQDVVPDAGLTIGGSGTSRSLTITPVTDVVGDAMITIVVTDRGGLSDGASFLLTVEPEQKSMRQFARDAFAQSADDEAALINAVEFAQDADDDDFADLLAQ